MVELSEGPDEGKQFLEQVAQKEKAAAEAELKAAVVETIKANEAKRGKKEPVPEPKKVYSPDYPVGRVFGGQGGDGGDRIVVDKALFYKLCVRMVRTNPRLGTMYVRMIGELLGITNFYEAQARWQEINAYHEKRAE